MVEKRAKLVSNNRLNVCEPNHCQLIQRDLNNNQFNPLNLNQLNGRETKNQLDSCDLNFDQLSLNDLINNQSRPRDLNNNQSKLRDLLETIFLQTDGQKFLIYRHLHRHIVEHTGIYHQCIDFANNSTRVKNLLLMKKETAISELLLNLPYINPENHEVKITYLRIMPVLFSHVSLYDVSIDDIYHIVDILRIHPAFTAQQGLFAQWFTMFDARRKSKRHFSFKDENYVRDLPPLTYSFSDDTFTHSVGYSDVALLRAFHRWLRLHRLHKYLYFFASLAYKEIFNLNEKNFDTYQEQVNLHVITIGAKHKILREIEILRDRRKCLLSILKVPFQSQQVVERTIQEIKRILRTPICLRDSLNEKLPELLLEAMAKVFDFVVRQTSVNEKMVSLFGLLISLCKESWNYNIFKPDERECFNEWRHKLMEKTGQTSSNLPYNIAKHQVAFLMDDLKLRDQTAGNTYYRCLEEVANNCADFIFKK